MGQPATRTGSRVRRRLGVLALAGATCMGGLAVVVEPAAAAPIAVEGSKPVIRNDGLAPIATAALAQLQAHLATSEPTALTEYLRIRDALAGDVAQRLGADPVRLVAAWNQADFPHQVAMMAAFTQLGVPYRRMASKPGVGFDCSGLTAYAWGVAGVTIIRQSARQINAAAPRTAETAMAGDLMYYPGHVMMYLGIDRAMVHAPYTGRTVEIDHASGKKSLRFGNPIG